MSTMNMLYELRVPARTWLYKVPCSCEELEIEFTSGLLPELLSGTHIKYSRDAVGCCKSAKAAAQRSAQQKIQARVQIFRALFGGSCRAVLEGAVQSVLHRSSLPGQRHLI
jgi:hypothetical protein